MFLEHKKHLWKMKAPKVLKKLETRSNKEIIITEIIKKEETASHVKKRMPR